MESGKKMAMGLLCCAVLLPPALFPSSGSAFEIQIEVSPNVFNIESPVDVLTIHTDIACADVVCSSVALQVADAVTVPVSSCKPDNRGNFVGKFSAAPVKTEPGLEFDDYNTFMMKGKTTAGEVFSGEQEIKVIAVIPEGLQ